MINLRKAQKSRPFSGGMAFANKTPIRSSSKIEVTRAQFAMPRMKQKLRIVAVSDIHASSIFGSLSNLISLINDESPDIFILAGDIIDKRGRESMVNKFEAIETRLIKVAVLGNWEYSGKLNIAALKSQYNKAGINLLVNEAIEADGLTVIGLDDLIGGIPDYEILRSLSSSGKPILIVSHCPEVFPFLASLSCAPMVVLSGHTHGGQIVPFGIVLVTPRGSGPYVHGWYHREDNSLYVMRGVGAHGLPIRIGARPEILVLDIEGRED